MYYSTPVIAAYESSRPVQLTRRGSQRKSMAVSQSLICGPETAISGSKMVMKNGSKLE
jgi:hypothetical protein